MTINSNLRSKLGSGLTLAALSGNKTPSPTKNINGLFSIGPISLLNPHTIAHLHKVRSLASLLETLQEGTKHFQFMFT